MKADCYTRHMLEVFSKHAVGLNNIVQGRLHADKKQILVR